MREAEFAELLGGAERTRITDTVLRFRTAGDDESMARISDLIRAETACCSFFEFRVAVEPAGSLVLDVQVPAAYREVLDALEAVRL